MLYINPVLELVDMTWSLLIWTMDMSSPVASLKRLSPVAYWYCVAVLRRSRFPSCIPTERKTCLNWRDVENYIELDINEDSEVFKICLSVLITCSCG